MMKLIRLLFNTYIYIDIIKRFEYLADRRILDISLYDLCWRQFVKKQQPISIKTIDTPTNSSKANYTLWETS